MTEGKNNFVIEPVEYHDKLLYSNSWALVAGINDYAQDGIPTLDFAEADADAVYARLQTLGFPEQNIRLLKGPEVTREAIEDILIFDFKEMASEDRLLFFFSGHGVSHESHGKHYGHLLMQNSTVVGEWPTRENPFLKNPPAKSCQMKGFFDMVESLPAKHKMVLVDSCFSGFMAKYKSTLKEKIKINSKQLSTFVNTPVIQVLTAGRAGEEALELDKYGHGLFTWYLLEGLAGHATSSDDGIISFAQLASFVEKRVTGEEDADQHPQVRKNGEGHFVFLYGDQPGSPVRKMLPDADEHLGKALSGITTANPSRYGTSGSVRRYEKGAIYFVKRKGNPSLDLEAFKENTACRIYDSEIGLRYETMGGPKSELGFPISEAGDAWVSQWNKHGSTGRYQFFEGGIIYHCERHGAHALLEGRIRDYFRESEMKRKKKEEIQVTGGFFGFPISEQIKASSCTGAVCNVQRFEFGLIADWGGNTVGVFKGFYDLYQSMKEWSGVLGFPISSEMLLLSTLPGKEGRIQLFENGCMIWGGGIKSCKYIAGSIYEKWANNKEAYGLPVNNPYPFDLYHQQLFEGDRISGYISSPVSGPDDWEADHELKSLATEKGAAKKTVTDQEIQEPEEEETPIAESAYKIALQANNGKFVSVAVESGGKLIADSNTIDKNGFEIFYVTELDRRRVQLQARNGQYVTVREGPGGELAATATAPGDAAAFEIVTLGENQVALQALLNSMFVSVEDWSKETPGLLADSRNIRGWQTFTLTRL